MGEKHKKIAHIAIGLSLGMAMTGPWSSAQAYTSPTHIFSINDVQGGFDGSTFGTAGPIQDNNIICGVAPGPACPDGVAPVVDKQGVTLYPVDSEFGFYVVDFLGAQQKEQDGDYQEGFVGDITDGGEIVGIKISNSATDTYKVKPPLGTWCAGLGGNSVKCSTEHYTVLEHVLSCHEVVPYFFADPDSGEQAVLSSPTGDSFNCADAELDDVLSVLVNGEPGLLLTDPTPGVQMEANDNTSVSNDIAVSADYSVTLKDDGKPLYRWGGLIKRPNDMRMYARLVLPEEWKQPGANFKVTKAQLVVNHWITNNPNDQLRPEDLENEAATGRQPSHKIDAGDIWKSTKACFEGDGDFIDTEEGATDPTALGIGTVLKNTTFAYPNLAGINPPQPFSSDLTEGFTNAWYTTIDRDPFEWSYDQDPDPNVQEFVGSPLPDDTLGELVSGPRWRLKANKFGQDIPGLEIPAQNCSPPPFTQDNIKYEVGIPVTTVINLLDWDEVADGPSPLSTSKGWVDLTTNPDGTLASNPNVTIAQTVNGVPVTTNGLPISNDFDLAVYVKGDRKSTAVFNARLEIDYEGEVPGEEPPADSTQN